jgi:hypothetical protein
MESGTRLALVQSGLKPDQKKRFGGPRYGRKMMGGEARRPTREGLMNKWHRQIHCWLFIAFTLTVIANFVAMTRGQPSAWVTYSPLAPLALLLLSGLYLFGLPHTAGWRDGRQASRQVGG